MKALAYTAACALALGVTGCGSDGATEGGDDGSDPSGDEVQIELFSWWTAPGEAEALQALMDLHQAEFPDQEIYNAAEVASNGGVDAKMVLAERLEKGDPPDVFQQNAFEVVAALATGTGKFEPLDELFEQQGLNDAMVPEVLENVTHEGHVYSMPVNIHRENSLFYNKQLFKEHDIAVPTTVDELLTACEKLKAAGVTPFAVSSQGWILGKTFEGLAGGAMGPDGFVNYYMEGIVDEAKLARAVEVYTTVIDQYSNIGEIDENFGWMEGAEAVADGEAAMFMHGDWVKGLLVQLGKTPNVDFGVVGAPGASDMFVYGVDVFVVPQGAKHKQEAFDFLTTVASPAGQAAFNNIKGSTPMRFDVPLKALDSVAQEVLTDFKNAKTRVRLRGSQALSDALAWYAWMNPEHPEYFGDANMLLQAAIQNPPNDE